MSSEALKENIKHIKEIVRELYVFTNQLELIQNLESSSNVVVNLKEKTLLKEAIISLQNQLKILNNTVPGLVENIKFYKKLETEKPIMFQTKEKFVQVEYRSEESEDKIFLTITEKDKQEFLENLSRSNLSMKQLKGKYAIEKEVANIGKPSLYSKLANNLFRNLSNKLIVNGYFSNLNRTLRKMNSIYILGTYVSMILFTMLVGFVASIFLFIFLLFFNISLTFPFISMVSEGILLRILQTIWLVFAIPIALGFFMYIYPVTEARSLGGRVDQELPFVVIHMSAIATSGVEPVNIFKIIIKSEEYKYTNKFFRKILNLINFHGEDLISALKKTSRTSPSIKLKELLDGLATSITSGGDIHQFLDKHSEDLLLDYKLDREKYIKTSETLMDIYISILIAAPMILLMLFVIIGSTNLLSIGFGTNILALLMILGIILLNVIFLGFLRLKQPIM